MKFSHRHRAPEGIALVLVLIFVVLLTGLVTAFLSRALATRGIANNSISQSNTDELARSVTDILIGNLKKEIILGSTATAVGSGTIYLPSQSNYLLPTRSGTIPNLLCVSGQTLSSPAVSCSTSLLSSTAASLNGKSITMSRWNQHYLIPRPSGSSATDTTPISGFPAPQWGFVTSNQGPQVITSPTTTVIGRFAYAIYDESGLLDMNVAGFPSVSTADQSGGKGYMAYADLTALGLSSTQVDGIVGWRNYASGMASGNFPSFSFASGASYASAIASNTTGFLTLSGSTQNGRTDQAVLSRQQLISLLLATGSDAGANALQYLGTFSRELDQPSYCPATVTGTNPNLLKITVQYTFNRPDGTTAAVGEPLLKHRFPLSRLALFNDPTTNAASIKKYFAMQSGTNGMWDYIDPDTSTVSSTLPTIKTLAQVAATNPGREPTFWELLQAGILADSLGTETSGTTYYAVHNAKTARQIFSIGLSLIDQYDADDIPTVIRFGGTDMPSSGYATAAENLFVSGVENLPYVEWIAQQHFRDTTTVVTSTSSYIDGYLMFGLWNPHRNAASAASGTFRIRANGKTTIRAISTAAGNTFDKTSTLITHNDTVIQFKTSASRKFNQIDALRASDADIANSSAYGKFPYPAGLSVLQVGLFLGQITTPTTPELVTGSATLTYSASLLPPTIVLETLSGTNWIPYQIYPRFYGLVGNNAFDFAKVSARMNAGTFPADAVNPPMVITFAHSDPRTNRLNMGWGGFTPTSSMLSNGFNLINSSGAAISSFYSPTGGGSTYGPADFAYNRSSGSYYNDSGSTRRNGDSNSTALDGSPSASFNHTTSDSPFYGAGNGSTVSSSASPVVLNRAFRSVSEMGYVFRDDPWRTLNFSSADSADAGLLDLFCLNENTNDCRAGVINLNSTSADVLAAILLGAYRDPVSSGSLLSVTNANNIANAIKNALGQSNSPTWVVNSAASLPMLTGTIAASLPDTVKFKREALARSFGGVTNARTWNIMLDIIAQTGRYAPSAKSLADFHVDGERRYWVHVAIDRYTARILDMQIEPVSP